MGVERGFFAGNQIFSNNLSLPIDLNYHQLASNGGSWLKNSLVTLSHMDIIHISFLTILLLWNIPNHSVVWIPFRHSQFWLLKYLLPTTVGLDLLVSGDGVFKKNLSKRMGPCFSTAYHWTLEWKESASPLVNCINCRHFLPKTTSITGES